MDKNTIIGFVLIFVVMFGFSYLNRPSQEQREAQKRYNDSIALVQKERNALQIKEAQERAQETETDFGSSQNADSLKQSRLYQVYGDFSQAAEGREEFIVLENEKIELKLSTKGGRIYSARLKDYSDYKDFEAGKDEPISLFEGIESEFGISFYLYDAKAINTSNFYFEAIKNSSDEAIMRLKTNAGEYIDFVYTIKPNDYMVDFKISSNQMGAIMAQNTQAVTLNWGQKSRQQEKGRTFEDRYTYLMYKFLSDDVEKLKESKDDSANPKGKIKWVGYKDQFFSSVLIAHDNFESTKLTSTRFEKGPYLKEYKTVTNIPFNPNTSNEANFSFFFGPNDFQMLKKYDKEMFEDYNLELEKLVPMGWSWLRPINKYIIIPVFGWLTSYPISLGLALFFLTLIIKIALFPLTYKSLVSSAKMRVLKPQVDEINEKYPGESKAMERQQKVMELYKKVGVSPMAGCWPMLIQFPFLIALFMFFPSAIELRHEGFLWAKDLSTYDTLISWDANIPIISSLLGNHISLFCLLMSIMTIVSQKISMSTTGNGQQQMPGMNLMLYLMPVMMFFFLNSYPAGLNYYYLISNIITLTLNLGSRLFINEDKLLLKLEANKKKAAKAPAKKKSGFMARLEEAQRQQEKLMKEQQKNKNKR